METPSGPPSFRPVDTLRNHGTARRFLGKPHHGGTELKNDFMNYHAPVPLARGGEDFAETSATYFSLSTDSGRPRHQAVRLRCAAFDSLSDFLLRAPDRVIGRCATLTRGALFALRRPSST